ncbi:MAG: helix-turn-helix domain-containing protein [Planctomycetes bacterium]|nr:helix-turn-helix domain-containing protein [Planctomycetota bacterium]
MEIVERLDLIIEQLARDREREEDKERLRYTTSQAAKRLNKSPWTVRRWCELGQVRGERIRLGRSGNRLEWRIDAAEVNRVAQDGPGHEGEFDNDD